VLEKVADSYVSARQLLLVLAKAVTVKTVGTRAGVASMPVVLPSM